MSDEAARQPRSKNNRCNTLTFFYKTVHFFICAACEPSLQDMQDNNHFADNTHSIWKVLYRTTRTHFQTEKKMQLGSGTNWGSPLLTECLMLHLAKSLNDTVLSGCNDWLQEVTWSTFNILITVSIVINIQFVLGEFSFQSIHSTWDDHIVDCRDLQTWIYCKKVKRSHESITGPTWWAMMLSLWSEGCRLNSTTSPSIRCLSTISPY